MPILLLLHEPWTTLTDYGMALEALLFAFLLWKGLLWKGLLNGGGRKAEKHSDERVRSSVVGLWAIAFVSVAIASTAAGTYHGFQPELSLEGKWLLWRTMTYALGCASAFILAATVVSELPRWMQGWGMGAIALKSLLHWNWTRSNPAFNGIVIDYLSAMLLVLLLHLPQCWVKAHGRWMMAGVLISFGAAAVQGIQFNLSAAIDHNVLYHLVQMAALLFFYQGACVLQHSSLRS
jgi:hypothetical protein